MRKVALITGITGQDGSYLTEILLEKDYDIHGIIRRTSQFNRSRIEQTRTDAQKRGLVFELHYGDVTESSSIYRIIAKVRPQEIYNLASQSHVGISFEEPEFTTEVNAMGVMRLLECVRHFGLSDCRIYQAASSELFGRPSQTPQTEQTPFEPLSPYGIAKLYAYWIIRRYRDHYGMHASNGILYNHESPRRGENFVTRKITYSLARIKSGKEETLELGNLDSRRDWGYAKDYVFMMWKMLQQPTPDDYIIATGQPHTVREFVDIAASICGYSIVWEGAGATEIGKDKKSGKTLIRVNPKFYRPNESFILTGDTSKAYRQLGWKPSVSFEQLVEIMMKADLGLGFVGLKD
ncbi:MAG: GDP-mannose 4,6-dehydratase [Chitinivibrionales bacterium]|nr:GDP-mannose 4,6-dehydratase [Chitinivibrionales bacterium]